MSHRKHPDDRLGLARNLLLASWLATASALGLMVLDASLRSSPGEAPLHGLAEGLSLSNLSVVPAGRPLRHPETLHPAIDLRFSPLLPKADTAPAGLLLRRAGSPAHGYAP